MKLKIITGCTKKKAAMPYNALSIKDFIKGQAHIANRERQLYNYKRPAIRMYTGQEHKSVRLSINTFFNIARESGLNWNFDWQILSAGYGFIPSDTEIVPYDCSFHYAKDRKILKKARPIISTGQTVFKNQCDLCIVALSYDYFAACDFLTSMEFGGPTICFCSQASRNKMPVQYHLKPILAGKDSARKNDQSDKMIKSFFIENLLHELFAAGFNTNQFIQQLMTAGNIVQMLRSVQLSQAWEDKKKEIKKLIA